MNIPLYCLIMNGGGAALILVLTTKKGDFVFSRDGDMVQPKDVKNPMHITLGYVPDRSTAKKDLISLLGNTFMTVVMNTDWHSRKIVPMKNAFQTDVVSVDEHQLTLANVASLVIEELSNLSTKVVPNTRLQHVEVNDLNTVTLPSEFRLRFAFSSKGLVADYIYPTRQQLTYKCFACEKDANYFDAAVIKSYCSKKCAI